MKVREFVFILLCFVGVSVSFGQINVRDFGAKGDGKTDDSDAIASAIKAAHKKSQSIPCPGAVYYGIEPEVVFPPGVYRISKPIVLNAYTRLRGKGNATIKPISSGQDIVQCLNAYRIQISGLCFIGGKRAIYIKTNNVDTANVQIDNCQFLACKGVAIYAEDRCNSTLLKVTNCIFYGCDQMLRNTCDKAILSDSWVTTSGKMKNKAVIENYGTLHMVNVLGVPHVSKGYDQRWVDNYGTVSCKSVRFGGEGGGFCVVNNYAKYRWKYPVVPNRIVLEDCELYCLGNRKRKAVIYCNEVPNQIIVSNCSGIIDVPIVKVDEKIDLRKYLSRAIRNPSLCRYVIRDNNVNEMWEALPEIMRRFSSRAMGAVNVKEIGARGNGIDDDTRFIQEAFNRAGKVGVGVVFPPGRYKVSDTIEVRVSQVRGEGYPEIIQVNPNKDIFFAPNTWRVSISGLKFRGGKDQISLGNKNIDQGFWIVSDCRFNYANGVAVRLREGSNSTFALIEKCAFRECMQVLIAVTDQTHLRDCWITASGKMKKKAVIENYGNLTCVNILGVPHVNGQDQRWIDNYGTLTCRKFRFGGEGGGFTPVVNFAKLRKKLSGPRILIDDCEVCALGNNERACAVYCEEIPNQIVISNTALYGVPGILVSSKIDLKTYFDGVRPGMLRYVLQNNFGEFAGKIPEEMLKAASRRKIKMKYKNQLSIRETQEALKKAIAIAKKIPSASPSKMIVKGKIVHIQQTDPKKYVEIGFDKYEWDVDDFMDGTSEKNSEYLAVAKAGDDIVILRRIGKGDDWPHVRVRNIKVDVGKFPWLSWRLKDNGLAPAGYAVKVIDNQSGKCVLLTERHWPPFFDYRAYDLRKIFGYKSGVHSFDIKFYFLGITFLDSQRTVRAKRGDFIVLDFLRVEGE